MSDISSDSSFELVSDSDHSDIDVVTDQLDDHTWNNDDSSVVEPKVLEQKVPEVYKSSSHSGSSFEKVIASDQSDVDKSPFESEQSAHDLQNTDHSDVIRQKVVEAEAIGLLTEKAASVKRKENKSDINLATDHSDDGNLLNTSQSDDIEPNVVEADTTEVLAEQMPMSPKKPTWNRRWNNHSGINQSSDHSDDNNILSEETRKLIQAEAVQAYIRLSEETRRKRHQQKLADADDRGFWMVFFSPAFLILFVLMISFLIIVSHAPVRTSSVRHNENPIVKKCNVTTGKVYNFHKEKEQKIMDEIERAKKNSEIQRSIQGMTRVEQLSENLWNKFVPDFRRFEGVEKFLQLTQTKETIVEDYLYYSSPRFVNKEGTLYLRFVFMNSLETVENFRIDDCVKFADCHYVHWFMKNGNLQIDEKFVLESQEYKFTRVYFIPPHEII